MKKTLLVLAFVQGVSLFGSASGGIVVRVEEGQPIAQEMWDPSMVLGLRTIFENIEELAMRDKWWSDIFKALSLALNLDQKEKYAQAINKINEKIQEKPEGAVLVFSIKDHPNLHNGDYDLRKIMQNIASKKRNIFDGAIVSDNPPMQRTIPFTSVGHEVLVPGDEGASILASARNLLYVFLNEKSDTISGQWAGPFVGEIHSKLKEYIDSGNLAGAKSYLSDLIEKASPHFKLLLDLVRQGKALSYGM